MACRTKMDMQRIIFARIWFEGLNTVGRVMARRFGILNSLRAQWWREAQMHRHLLPQPLRVQLS